MSKKMLIDAAHPEEVRVAVMSQNRIEDFDFESAAKKPLRGNIFLARVTRVEPSLQAAFVDYGGNRHGFLAFSEIHPDYYQIPVSDREALQAAEEEVAKLAQQLELIERGDDDDDDDPVHNNSLSSDDDDDEGTDRSEDDDASDTPAAIGLTTAPAETLTTEASDDENNDDAPSEETPASGAEEENDDEEDEEETERETDEDAPIEGDNQGERKRAADASEASEPDIDANADDADVDENALASTADGDDENADDDDADRDDDEVTIAEAVDSDKDDDASEDLEAREGDTNDERENRNALFEQYKEAKRKRAHLLRNYKIQEVIKRRQILLIQVVKEERGNKGAALTTYMSLAGRYCVLMPNTARGGGISRKIANNADRRRLRRVVDSLEVPQGMGLIIRTAGAKRTKTEIKRDYDYLLRLWENIRLLTLKSIAPCRIYEEASLIKRAIRDLYDKDISMVYVEGEDGYREAKDFMKMLMPSHAKNVQPYKDRAPIFLKHGVESQLDGMYQPTVRLKSGGYLVIHQTEALVAIDVNSGRATRERNIEQTALKTNIEAAEEAARQFRLRDLAGLIVIDFIDMEEQRNNRKVEKAIKEAMKSDRARVQIGRISSFGLMELSRQRRRSGIVDGTTQACPTCVGAGVIRSHEVASLRILRAVEGEAITGKAGLLSVRASTEVALHVLNNNRDWLTRIEQLNGVSIELIADPKKHGDEYEIDKSGAPRPVDKDHNAVQADQTDPIAIEDEEETAIADTDESDADAEERKGRKKRRRRRGRRDKNSETVAAESENAEPVADEADANANAAADETDGEDEKPKKRRRRGRRGGRRNRRDGDQGESSSADASGQQAETNATADSASDAPSTPTDAATGDQTVTEEQPAAVTTQEQPTAESPKDDTGADIADAPFHVSASADFSVNGDASNGDDLAPPAEPTPEPNAATEQEVPPEEAEPKPKKKSRRGWWQRSAS